MVGQLTSLGGTAVTTKGGAEANRIVQKAVDAAIAEDGEIGLQVAAYLNGELAVDVWGGLADETTGRRVEGDTLFPVFSATKAVTATALHIQAERGLIDYDQPIAHYWPEFAAQGKDKARVRDALTHRTGIPLMPEGVSPAQMCDFDWMVDRLATAMKSCSDMSSWSQIILSSMTSTRGVRHAQSCL
jgi:CubicO group peptidase (beta-lactamase class C family)